MATATLLEDTPEHYLITDPSGRSFIIPKKGLSRDQEKRILALPREKKDYAPVSVRDATLQDNLDSAQSAGDVADARHADQKSEIQKSEDKLEVNIGGHRTIIPRGDMSDEEWARIIKDAQNKSVDARLKLGPGPTITEKKGGGASFKGLPIGRLVSSEIQGATPPKLDTSIDVKEPGGAVAPVDQRAPAPAPKPAPAPRQFEADSNYSETPAPNLAPQGGPLQTGATGGAGGEGESQPSFKAQDPNQGKGILDSVSSVLTGGISNVNAPNLEALGGTARDATQMLTGQQIGNGQPPLRTPQQPIPDQTPPEVAPAPAPAPAPASMPGIPQMGGPDRAAELDAAAKQFADAQMESVGKLHEISQERQKSQLQALKRSQELQQMALGAQSRMMQDQQDQAAAYNKAKAAIADPAKVNPDRFWQTHGRVWGALVGALAARQGRDPAATIANAVRADVEDQVAAFNSQRQLKADALEQATRPYDMLIKADMDQVNAVKGAQAIILEQMNMQAQYFASLTEDATAKSKAQELIANNTKEITKLKMDMDRRRQEISLQREKVITDRQQAIWEHEDRQAKINGAGGGRPLPLQAVQQQAAQKSVLQKLRGMDKELEGMNIVGRTVGSLDPTGTTTASKFNMQGEIMVPEIAAAIAKTGRVTKFDMDYAQKLIVRASSLGAKQRYKFIIKSIEDKVRQNNEAMRAAGFKVTDSSEETDEAPEDMGQDEPE